MKSTRITLGTLVFIMLSLLLVQQSTSFALATHGRMTIRPTATPKALSLENYWNTTFGLHNIDLNCFVPCWNDYQVGKTEFQTIAQDIQDVYNLSSDELLVYDEKLDITAPNNYIYSGYANSDWAIFSDDTQPLPRLETYGLYFPINKQASDGEYYVPLHVRQSLTATSLFSREDYQPTHIYSAHRDATTEFIVIFDYDDLGVAYQYYGHLLPNNDLPESACSDIEIIGVTIWVYDGESEETIIELLNRKLEENDLSQLYLGMRGIDFEFSEIEITDENANQIEHIQESNCLLDLILFRD